MKHESLEQRVERQLELEKEYRTRSLKKSRELVQKALDANNLSSLPKVSRMIAAAYDTVAAGIDAMKVQKAPGIGGKYRSVIRLVPTDVLAVMALTKCIDSLFVKESGGSRVSAQALLANLGRQVQAEVLSIQLETVAPAYMNRVYEYLKERNTTSQSHILKTLRASAENVHYGHEPWPASQCIAVGKLILQPVWETGLFTWDKGSDASQLQYLAPSEELAEVLQDLVEDADTVEIKPPMLVPPQPHTDMFSGGYLLRSTCKRGTYHNHQITRAMLREVAEAFKEAPELQGMLNKAQSVPYVINKDILALVNEARRTGVTTGMPSSYPAPKPEWYLDGVPKEEYTARQMDDFQTWKMNMRNWYIQERTRVSKLRSMVSLVQICEEFKDEQELYFPTCVDWRYRLYFKSSLHPQGSDMQKALLMFARRKPLGERGLFWLKVHVATCFGYDKALFEKRAAWTDANIEQVRSVARAPFDSEAFKSADAPWCFLAACIDLVNALDSESPELYESGIPVAMDATNSGSQHFSALLRDPVGGKLTNLFWEGNEEKADMYMDVKQRTDAKVIMDLDNPEFVVQANFWRENAITRSMTKRPCMTHVYSATVRSCSEYILQSAQEEGYEGTEEYSLFKLAGYLSTRMKAAVEDANPAATEAMKYLQSLCYRVPAAQHLQWKTPLGGLVINRYTESEETTVNVRSMNLTQLLVYNRNYDVNNKRKAKSGISPNWIHSLDATHLGMIINSFDGDIMPIHDSVATHACDVDAMHAVIREQFLKLYTEHDVLQEITDAAVACGADLEGLELPAKGSLNLMQVLDSKFFFC